MKCLSNLARLGWLLTTGIRGSNLGSRLQRTQITKEGCQCCEQNMETHIVEKMA